jgi:hypothetical protein
MTTNQPPPPVELGPAGSALWASLVDRYDLEQHELALMLQACRCCDRLDALAAAAATATVVTTKGDIATHPALVESRQQSLTLARLLASLRLPLGESDDGSLARPQVRGGARKPYAMRRAS